MQVAIIETWQVYIKNLLCMTNSLVIFPDTILTSSIKYITVFNVDKKLVEISLISLDVI